MRKPHEIWLPVLLVCLAPLTANAQNGSTVQGGGSFLVQCPQYTPFHPSPALAPAQYPTPTSDAQEQLHPYHGPVVVTEPVGNAPTSLTYLSHGGAIRCQEISGGDGMMTEADGNQTFMFSFGPLSGLDNIKHGQPGTLINTAFNGTPLDSTGTPIVDSSGNPIMLHYNNMVLPSVCGPAAPASCATAGAAGIAGGNITDPTFDASKVLPAGTVSVGGSPASPGPYLNSNAGIADPATIMTVGVLNGNIPAPLMAFDEDDEFFLTLSNVGMIMRPDLFEQHTVHFHGYPNASSYYDGVPDATWAINIGGSATYYYLAPDAGTYFWHCHITPPEHLQMGMVGQLYVRPRQNRVPSGTGLYASVSGNTAPGTADAGQQSDLRTSCPGTGTPMVTNYNTTLPAAPDILCSAPLPIKSLATASQQIDPFAGKDPRIPAGTLQKYVFNDGDGSTAYEIDVPIQIHGFDPNFHFVGMTFNPEGFADMKDKYFLLNGRSYPDTVGVPGYPGGPSMTAANASGSPDAASYAIGTEDTDGRTRFSQPLPTLIMLIQGERAALRIADLDVTEYQTLASLGVPMKEVGFQAKLLRDEAGNNTAIYTNSVTLGGGESVDVILDSTGVPTGTYFLYTSNLDHLSNDAENFGGLMTEVLVCSSISSSGTCNF
jgi:FtsP/CotA-like multicopper oxidase with cupredoxin domain